MPVEGAHVTLWKAGPRTGYSQYCPGCYRDCGRTVQTGPNGVFTFHDIEDGLLFSVMVSADGYVPMETKRFDPLEFAGQVKVTKRGLLPADPFVVLKGRVVDEAGRPVAGAEISPRMFFWKEPDGRTTGSSSSGGEDIAYTREDGTFLMVLGRRCKAASFIITAPTLAPLYVKNAAVGEIEDDYVLRMGVTIRGRVVDESGTPIPGVQLVLAQQSRMIDTFIGKFEYAADNRGRFEIPNIPAFPTDERNHVARRQTINTQGEVVPVIEKNPTSERYWLVAHTDSLDGRGYTPRFEVFLDNEDTDVELGDLVPTKGVSIEGRVVLSDGNPIPEGMTIFATRPDNWDSQIYQLPPDGTFRFDHLPPNEELHISPSVKGYRVSRSHPSVEQNGFAIKGKLESSMTGFVLLLEPGKPERLDYQALTQEQLAAFNTLRVFESYKP
ncbi:MAG: hypothetical protein H6815_09755 [Phycisphaeraceae bacterium]|nr:hypothetical protein [Phycisphaerales bacterium]MCB9860721.1 hypothetical protein [Phycisphaeraceae bacterium]